MHLLLQLNRLLVPVIHSSQVVIVAAKAQSYYRKKGQMKSWIFIRLGLVVPQKEKTLCVWYLLTHCLLCDALALLVLLGGLGDGKTCKLGIWSANCLCDVLGKLREARELVRRIPGGRDCFSFSALS
jgi:hypothetical protein